MLCLKMSTGHVAFVHSDSTCTHHVEEGGMFLLISMLECVICLTLSCCNAHLS